MKYILFLIFSFFVFLAVSVYMFNLPLEVLAVYLLLSFITYIVYYLDKKAAIKGKWRTKETNLHLLSLLGGWPGALIAQKVHRHKSSKQPFKTILWITIVTNCCFSIYMITPNGYENILELLSKIV